MLLKQSKIKVFTLFNDIPFLSLMELQLCTLLPIMHLFRISFRNRVKIVRFVSSTRNPTIPFSQILMRNTVEMCSSGLWRPRARLTKAYDVTIQRYRNSHAKIEDKKCIFCGVWVYYFVWNFKGTLWIFAQNFEPMHRKIYILRGVKNLTTYAILDYDILSLSEMGPWMIVIMLVTWFMLPHGDVMVNKHRCDGPVVSLWIRGCQQVTDEVWKIPDQGENFRWACDFWISNQ